MDSSVLFFLLIGLFILAFAGIIVLSIQQAKKRRLAFEAFATANQLSPWPEAAAVASLKAFPLFQASHTVQFKNGYYTQQGQVHFCVGDLTYVFGHGKSRQNYTQTVLLVINPQMQLPAMTVFRRGFLNALMRKEAGSDVPLPHVPGFDKEWRMLSYAPEQAAAFMTPVAASVITQAGDLWWKTLGNQMLIFQSRKPQKIDQLTAWYQRVSSAAQQVLAAHSLPISPPHWTPRV